MHIQYMAYVLLIASWPFTKSGGNGWGAFLKFRSISISSATLLKQRITPVQSTLTLKRPDDENLISEVGSIKVWWDEAVLYDTVSVGAYYLQPQMLALYQTSHNYPVDTSHELATTPVTGLGMADTLQLQQSTDNALNSLRNSGLPEPA